MTSEVWSRACAETDVCEWYDLEDISCDWQKNPSNFKLLWKPWPRYMRRQGPETLCAWEWRSHIMNAFIVYPTGSVMTHALFGSFCNSEKYSFSLKIKIGGAQLPAAFEWAIVVASSLFPQIFESTWPCFRSQRTISWSAYCSANRRTQSALYVNSDLFITPSFFRVSRNKRS